MIEFPPSEPPFIVATFLFSFLPKSASPPICRSRGKTENSAAATAAAAFATATVALAAATAA